MLTLFFWVNLLIDLYFLEVNLGKPTVKVEVKQGSCRYKIIISNPFSCECSSLQIANRRIYPHIVWLRLNLCNITEGNQVLTQVDIGRSVLENLILKVPDEIPDSLTRIHIDRTYNDKLINHSLFQRDQVCYLGRNVSESPYRYSGPWRIQNNDFHLYVQSLLLLKEQRVRDTKLRFCLSTFYVNGFQVRTTTLDHWVINQSLLTHNLRE